MFSANGFPGGSSADYVSGCELHGSTNLGSGSGAPGSLDGCKFCWVGNT